MRIPDCVGSALSFALKLKNKNSGASQTHSPKKVAISANPGAGFTPATGLPYLLCLASWVMRAK
jgi:hypothetical protein